MVKKCQEKQYLLFFELKKNKAFVRENEKNCSNKKKKRKLNLILHEIIFKICKNHSSAPSLSESN